MFARAEWFQGPFFEVSCACESFAIGTQYLSVGWVVDRDLLHYRKGLFVTPGHAQGCCELQSDHFFFRLS